MDNYREDGETEGEEWCSGWGAEGIENNKTSLITVGYRGLIRILCHIVIKHMGSWAGMLRWLIKDEACVTAAHRQEATSLLTKEA